MAITTSREQRRRENHERALAAYLEHHAAAVALISRSRKDGLGTMCTEHWRSHVKGLREARKVAVASSEATNGMGADAA